MKLLFDVPGDRVLGRRGDLAVLYPLPDNPSWLTGPQFTYIPYADPIDGKFLMQFDDLGKAVFAYYFSNSSMYTFVYAGNEIVDIDITENATEPDLDRRLYELRSLDRYPEMSDGRHLCSSGVDIEAGADSALMSFVDGIANAVSGTLIISCRCFRHSS